MEIFASQWGPKVNSGKFKVMTNVNENIVIDDETIEKKSTFWGQLFQLHLKNNSTSLKRFEGKNLRTKRHSILHQN